MKVLCNKTTKKIEAFSRWDDIEHNTNTHVLIIVDHVPDFKTERLNDIENDIRPVTQAELDADADAEKDAQSDIETSIGGADRALALVFFAEINLLRVEAGLPERTLAQLKSAVKAKL